MKTKLPIASFALLLIGWTVGCAEYNPIAPRVQPPQQGRRLVNGPDSQIVELEYPTPNTVPLFNYLWPTWVQVDVSGAVYLKSKFGSRTNYDGPVYGTGIFAQGGQQCAMQVEVYYPQSDPTVDLTPGPCGGGGYAATVMVRGNGTAHRYDMPPEDTDACGYMIPCHTTEAIPDMPQIISIRALPVAATLASDHGTLPFAGSFYLVNFTAGRNPATLIVNGKPNSHPFTVTSWNWVGADTTREDPTAGRCPFPTVNPACQWYAQEAGRMTAKIFTGGWEQVRSLSVQCLLAPADSLLNDSTGDFQFRTTFLTALSDANADSAAGKGATAEHRGFKHETGGAVWKLPNGGYLAVPYDDPTATECHWDPGPAVRADPPVPNARVVAVYHTHPSDKKHDKVVYGCTADSTSIQPSQYPGDGRKPSVIEDAKKTGGGSGWKYGDKSGDWPTADALQVPVYVLQKDGTAWRLDPNYPFPKKNNPNHWSAFGKAFDSNHPAGRCT